MLAVAQRDAGIATVGRALPSVFVGLNHDLFCRPSLAVIAAAVESIGRLEPGGEHHDVPGGFIEGHVCEFAPANVVAPVTPVVRHVGLDLHTLADDDGLAPCFAAVFAAFYINPTLFAVFFEDEHGAVLGHGEVAHHRDFLGPSFVKRFLTGDLVWKIDCRHFGKPS